MQKVGHQEPDYYTIVAPESSTDQVPYKYDITENIRVYRHTKYRAYYLWRVYKKIGDHSLKTLNDSIINQIGVADFVSKFFSCVKDCTEFYLKNVKALYKDAAELWPYGTFISYNSFYNNFKQFGFRYQNKLYKPIAKRIAIQGHLNDFLDVYLYFVTSSDRFVVVYVDESSICPSNFKKKYWKMIGKLNHVKTSIKYEKIVLLGVMTGDKLLALQLISSISTVVFFALHPRSHLPHRLWSPRKNKS